MEKVPIVAPCWNQLDSASVWRATKISGYNLISYYESVFFLFFVLANEYVPLGSYLADESCPESPVCSSANSMGSSCSNSRTSSSSHDSQCGRQVTSSRSSRPLEERRCSRANVHTTTDATKSLTLLPQVRSFFIPSISALLLEDEQCLINLSISTNASIES